MEEVAVNNKVGGQFYSRSFPTNGNNNCDRMYLFLKAEVITLGNKMYLDNVLE